MGTTITIKRMRAAFARNTREEGRIQARACAWTRLARNARVRARCACSSVRCSKRRGAAHASAFVSLCVCVACANSAARSQRGGVLRVPRSPHPQRWRMRFTASARTSAFAFGI
jgi:hypothetical protein